MSATESSSVPVLNGQGHPIGMLVISLPISTRGRGCIEPLLDFRDDPTYDSTLAPVQLLEESEYRYSLILEPSYDVPVQLEPSELFSPDTADWRSGRLRPKLYTGTLPITVVSGGQELGSVSVEVRSRKLNYLDQYRWMLEEIADTLADLIMERFAPTEQRFAVNPSRDAATLYSRFALLKTLFSGEVFEAAVLQILSNPHRTWQEEGEFRRPGQPVPMSGRTLQKLTQPGPRTAYDSDLSITSLPSRIEVTRTEETLDTAENRFVKFVLRQWQDFVYEVQQALLQEKENAPVRRGLREVQSVLERIQDLLSADLFHEVGNLDYLPAGSQVLQKRAGYRDIYRAYVQFEAASQLTWDGGEDVYGAGKRDVAALYEYWVFLQMVKVMGRLCQQQFDVTQLLQFRSDGMGVSLRKGRTQCLKGSIDRLGRKLKIELWFNKTFSHRLGDHSSWSRSMRPDFSIRITPEKLYGETDEIWIHFDAKYRVETITGLFGKDPVSEKEEDALLAEEQSAEGKQMSKRADLLKMHAYRDAIHRSAGAYVIYPGKEREPLRKFHEILPGLGAFALRPTADGHDTGVDALYNFLNDVVTHAATQTTQHERTRFWVRESTRSNDKVTPQPAVPFLTKPPADTLVLLGYVKSMQHLHWIHRHKLYNLRADGRPGAVLPDSHELAAELVVLYNPQLDFVEVWRNHSSPLLMNKVEMTRLHYPRPKGIYFCLRLQEIPHEQWPQALTVQRIQAVRAAQNNAAKPGAPVAVSWMHLIGSPEPIRV